MDLHRDDNSVTGKWAGAFGNEQAISGTWRDGNLELTFSGEWRDSPKSTPIAAAATRNSLVRFRADATSPSAENRLTGIWPNFAQLHGMRPT